MNDLTGTPEKEFNVIEVSDYTLDFQIIQNPNESWTYCLQIFPAENNIESLDEEYVPNLGRIKKIKDVNAALIYGREFYTHWEYAAETVMDIVESLGFRVNEDLHYFEVCFWDNTKHERIVKKGVSDGVDFRLVKE